MPSQVLVSCGFWDNSIRCYGVDDGRLLQTLRQHKDIVTCIAVAANGATLVSGRRALHVWVRAGEGHMSPHTRLCLSVILS